MSTEREPASDADPQGGGIRLCHIHAGLLQLGHERAEVFGVALGHGHVAAGDRAGDQESAGFDAVGDDGVLGAVQALHALNTDQRGAGALDLGYPF